MRFPMWKLGRLYDDFIETCSDTMARTRLDHCDEMKIQDIFAARRFKFESKLSNFDWYAC